MKKILQFLKATGLLVAIALLVTGCGKKHEAGSTAAKVITGKAAAGAPIIGSVTIKDSSNPAKTKQVAIAADGTYTVDVSDLKAPYMVRADGYVGGNDYHLYSAATSADVGGTINITPLTDLIVANIAGSVAQTYFDNGSFSGLTATQLTTQTAALAAKLQPILAAVGLSGSIDLLRASFSTDHTGLDAALDVIRVSTDTNTNVATISNIITAETITSNLATQNYSGTLTSATTTAVAAGITDIQAISNGFKTFSSLFTNSLPSPTNATLLGLFDSGTFMQEGRNLDTTLSELTSDPNMVGISFSNISIQSMDTEAGTCIVAFDVIKSGIVQNDGPRPWHMIKKNGSWYMQGDQRIANVEIRPRAEYQPNSGNPNKMTTGLWINIEDRGLKGITSAVVKGTGLPSQGVTLSRQINFEWFSIDGNPYGSNVYLLDDTTIGTIAETGQEYTVDLYIDATLQATYTEKIKKRPYKLSELTTAVFPAVTAPTLSALRAFNGGTIAVTWTLPTGFTNAWTELTLSDSNGSNTARTEYDPSPTATSHTFTMSATSNNGPFTPTNRMIWISAWDVDGRELALGFY